MCTGEYISWGFVTLFRHVVFWFICPDCELIRIKNFSAKATDEYELARKKVAVFVNAREWDEIVFTRNATEAINLVANSWGLSNIKAGDEVYSLKCCFAFPIDLMLLNFKKHKYGSPYQSNCDVFLLCKSFLSFMSKKIGHPPSFLIRLPSFFSMRYWEYLDDNTNNQIVLDYKFITLAHSHFKRNKFYREIPRGNPGLSAFWRDRQTFYSIHVVTLSFQLFHMVDKREVFLLTLRYSFWT